MTVWSKVPNKAIEANAVDEFSRQTDILFALGGGFKNKRREEPGGLGEKNLKDLFGQASFFLPCIFTSNVQTLRLLEGKGASRCHAPSLFLITSHFNLDLHVDLSELGQGLYKALVSNSPNNKQEKA